MLILLALDLLVHGLPTALIAGAIGGTVLALPLALSDLLQRTPLRPGRGPR